MPIWDGATAVLLERSSAGQTASVLGAGDVALAACDDAGMVTGADGSLLMTAAFSMPQGASLGAPGADLKRLQAHVDVADATGAPVGAVTVRRFSVGPFKKRFELALVDAGGAEAGELATTDKKGREFAVTCGGTTVARLALADRDRSLKRTLERWTLSVESRPPPPADLLVAAAILRYGKLFSEVSAPGPR